MQRLAMDLLRPAVRIEAGLASLSQPCYSYRLRSLISAKKKECHVWKRNHVYPRQAWRN